MTSVIGRRFENYRNADLKEVEVIFLVVRAARQTTSKKTILSVKKSSVVK